MKGIYDKKGEAEYDYLYRLLVNGVALTTRFKPPEFSRYSDRRMKLGQYIKLLQEFKELEKIRIVTVIGITNPEPAEFIVEELHVTSFKYLSLSIQAA